MARKASESDQTKPDEVRESKRGDVKGGVKESVEVVAPPDAPKVPTRAKAQR